MKGKLTVTCAKFSPSLILCWITVSEFILLLAVCYSPTNILSMTSKAKAPAVVFLK